MIEEVNTVSDHAVCGVLVAVAVVVLGIGESARDGDVAAGIEIGGDGAGEVPPRLNVDPDTGTSVDGKTERGDDAAVCVRHVSRHLSAMS
jgi:hypothetical protein